MNQPADNGEREIDSHVLGEMASAIGTDGMAGLISTFLQDLRRQVPDFEDALARSDLPQAQRCVHSLKSAAAYLGALAFAQRCVELERYAQAGDVKAMNALLTEFRERALRVERELQSQAGDTSPA